MIDLDYELRIKGQFDPEFFSISSTGRVLAGGAHMSTSFIFFITLL